MEQQSALGSMRGLAVLQAKRYELRGLLGEGGMGFIYQAYDPVLERDVALKVMKAEVPVHERRRFRREAIFGARFCHPSIVRVFDMGRMPDPVDEDGVAEWFTMEFLPGVDMDQVVRKRAERGEHAPLRSVGDVFRQVLAALQYAHDCGVIHRDVKPANIFVTRDPNTKFVTTKLLDFGVCLDLLGPREREPLLGDPRYMAPEQTRSGHVVDPRADIYSTGMSLWEVLAGEHPFAHLLDQGPRVWFEAQRRRPLPPLSRMLAPGTDRALAEGLDALLLRACAKKPEDRFDSAKTMQQELLEILASAEPGVPLPR